MSELIKNRQYRKEKIKEIILELHQGKSVEQVKDKFDTLVKDIAPFELAAIEQELIKEGLPVEEVRRLCDVHLTVFQKALEKTPQKDLPPGHPIDTFKLENRAIEKLVAETKEVLAAFAKDSCRDNLLHLHGKINLLWDVEKHYSRKENLLFPFLEKYEISGPSKIMWSHDDEIRDLLKEVKKMVAAFNPQDKKLLVDKVQLLCQKILEMIKKEEKVLFDTALKVLSPDEWNQIMEDSEEIGYCLIEPQREWKPANTSGKMGIGEGKTGYLKLPTGILTLKELNLILDNLPVDITFVDKEGIVKYFSNNKERIFVRARSIIGRRVENCHPPASVDVVEKLVEDLASGRKDYEDFWLPFEDKFVYIRYLALRDENNQFLGVVEVSQNIKPFFSITGEKRIAD